MSAPYHLIRSPETIAEQFVLYCTDRFSRDNFEDEVNDYGNVFGHRTAFIVHYCMATVVYFEVAWVRGEKWVFPNIPPEMEKMTSRRGTTLPALAQGVGETHRKRCGSQMFETVALFFGAHAVLERRNDTLPVQAAS